MNDLLEEGNPLRKKRLKRQGFVDYTSSKYFDIWKSSILDWPVREMEDPGDIKIRKKYIELSKSNPKLAEKYLQSSYQKYLEGIKSPVARDYEKLMEIQGVQVFIDYESLDDKNYKEGSYNYRMVKYGVLSMLNYIRDILPNRKPRIIIANLRKNKYTSTFSSRGNPAGGMVIRKMIFINEFQIDDPDYYIHEYAHYVADLIASQTKKMLLNSFHKLINFYYQKYSKARKPAKGESLSDFQRARMARILGFGNYDYALTNADEFFAVLIEKWKSLPNNKITYKMKTLVKNILARL